MEFSDNRQKDPLGLPNQPASLAALCILTPLLLLLVSAEADEGNTVRGDRVQAVEDLVRDLQVAVQSLTHTNAALTDTVTGLAARVVELETREDSTRRTSTTTRPFDPWILPDNDPSLARHRSLYGEQRGRRATGVDGDEEEDGAWSEELPGVAMTAPNDGFKRMVMHGNLEVRYWATARHLSHTSYHPSTLAYLASYLGTTTTDDGPPRRP